MLNQRLTRVTSVCGALVMRVRTTFLLSNLEFII